MNSFSLRTNFKIVTLIPILEIRKPRHGEIKYLSQVIEPGSNWARIQTEAVYPQIELPDPLRCSVYADYK